MNKNIIKLLLVTLALVSALFFTEIFLRLFLPEPENLAKLKSSNLFLHENKPNATFPYIREGEYDNVISINSFGFRDDEFSTGKNEGVFRIAVLGDSQEEALQVPLEDTWEKVMARDLSERLDGEVETYNFGVSGYGTDQQWLTLREKVWQFSPDMIILAFSPNDVGDTYKNGLVVLEDEKLKTLDTKARSGGNFLGRLARETYIYHLIIKASSGNDFTKKFVDKVRVKFLGFDEETRFFLSDAQLVQGPFEVIASSKNPPQEVLDTWATVRALVSDMKSQAQANGADFMITINIPRAQVEGGDWEFLRDKYELDPDASSPHEINDKMGSIAQALEIDFYDPREDAIAWFEENGPLHLKVDAHFNKGGNLFMGSSVAEYIVENNLVK